MNFNDFYWHDAVIKNVIINRRNPGIEDSISFEIEWSEEKKAGFLMFEGVYWASMNLNFGIVAEESILSANQLTDGNDDLITFYSKWKGRMDEVTLSTYVIELSSTGSLIKIISKSFKIEYSN